MHANSCPLESPTLGAVEVTEHSLPTTLANEDCTELLVWLWRKERKGACSEMLQRTSRQEEFDLKHAKCLQGVYVVCAGTGSVAPLFQLQLLYSYRVHQVSIHGACAYHARGNNNRITNKGKEDQTRDVVLEHEDTFEQLWPLSYAPLSERGMPCRKKDSKANNSCVLLWAWTQ